MTARHLRSPGLFCVLGNLKKALVSMVSICPPISNSSFQLFPSLWGLFHALQIQLVLPSSSCFTVLSQDPNTSLFINFFPFSLSGPLGRQNQLYGKFSFLLIITKSYLLARIWKIFLSQNPRASHYLGRI